MADFIGVDRRNKKNKEIIQEIKDNARVTCVIESEAIPKNVMGIIE